MRIALWQLVPLVVATIGIRRAPPCRYAQGGRADLPARREDGLTRLLALFAGDAILACMVSACAATSQGNVSLRGATSTGQSAPSGAAQFLGSDASLLQPGAREVGLINSIVMTGNTNHHTQHHRVAMSAAPSARSPKLALMGHNPLLIPTASCPKGSDDIRPVPSSPCRTVSRFGIEG